MKIYPGDNLLYIALTPKPPAWEDINFELTRYATKSIKTLGSDKQEKILRILNRTHDAVAANTDVQKYIEIWGVFANIISDVGRQGYTVSNIHETIKEFMNFELIDSSEREEYVKNLRNYHQKQYSANRDKIEHEELKKIITFSKKLLTLYIQYLEKT